jgi:hypothetical protein
VLGSADPEQDMTQGNSIYKTDGTKATAPAAISRANSASESVKKRANNKQVRITRFGFVPASRLRADELDRDDRDQHVDPEAETAADAEADDQEASR